MYMIYASIVYRASLKRLCFQQWQSRQFKSNLLMVRNYKIYIVQKTKCLLDNMRRLSKPRYRIKQNCKKMRLSFDSIFHLQLFCLIKTLAELCGMVQHCYLSTPEAEGRDHAFEVNLAYIMSSRPATATEQDRTWKQTNEQTNNLATTITTKLAE